jgi:alanine racemase
MTASIYPAAGAPSPVALAVPDPGHRAWVEVDVGAVRRNFARLARRAGVPLVAMVKADGYGLGAEAVARAIGAPFADGPAGGHVPMAGRGADGPWALGVATLDEAHALRAAGCRARLLCCSPLLDEAFADARALGVTPSLARPGQLRRWRALGGGAWHLNIDTGMQRAGVRWDDHAALDALRPLLEAHPPEGVYTHFHSADLADDSRREQERRFDAACAALGARALPPVVVRHTDNSAALLARAGAHGQVARAGIALYGAVAGAPLGLESVVQVRARVIDLHDLQAGDTVSYGATWRADGPRRVATLGIGHGDGLRRAFGGTAAVLLGGRRCPIVGVITMDMTMVDVTGVPCAIGDVATVFGRDGDLSAELADVAVAAGLSPYEVLVGLRLRLPRRVVGAESAL